MIHVILIEEVNLQYYVNNDIICISCAKCQLPIGKTFNDKDL